MQKTANIIDLFDDDSVAAHTTNVNPPISPSTNLHQQSQQAAFDPFGIQNSSAPVGNSRIRAPSLSTSPPAVQNTQSADDFGDFISSAPSTSENTGWFFILLLWRQ